MAYDALHDADTGEDRYKILIVDDSPTIRVMIQESLKADGIDVRSAENGAQALDMLADELPDLILLDVIMPGMNGIDVCREIKNRDEYKHVPILILTGVSDVKNKVLGLNAGASDYLVKPFAVEELRARINSIFRAQELMANLKAEIIERKRAVEERDVLIASLEKALVEVRKLSGLLPICASCKKIRNDEGYWQQIETYIGERAEVDFSHGVCPSCARQYFPEAFDGSDWDEE